MTNLINRFDRLTNKHEVLHSEFRVVELEKKIKIKKLKKIKKKKNAQNTSRYIRREITEINPLHTSIPDNVLEKKVCDALSLASILVKQDDLHVCYWITDQNKVIINFKDRKQAYHVMYNRKKLPKQ